MHIRGINRSEWSIKSLFVLDNHWSATRRRHLEKKQNGQSSKIAKRRRGCGGRVYTEDGSKALFSATLKGIDVTIQLKCSSCQFKQTEFVEKSMTHRCERCNLKQASLAFSTCFRGKATILTADGDERVLLTSSALTTYLRAAELSSAFNDAEAIEDHFLQSAVFDVKVNVDGFLLSIEAADARRASAGADDQRAGDTDEGASQMTEQVDPQLAEKSASQVAEQVDPQLAEEGASQVAEQVEAQLAEEGGAATPGSVA